ncbi:uncharacterized protein LOC128954606 [Oppia nitens]|uniref:uncharacterized protein LOC128954606 n=1 Tax=Oppia nitens TaxID=1686743 RepID=UPI0023D9FDFB|nr:uncharacterized protein LOC128954606 [Oppia nitens]
MVTIDELPQEIVDKILVLLSFNDRLLASRVCRRWHSLVFNTAAVSSAVRFCIRYKTSNNNEEDNQKTIYESKQLYWKAMDVLANSFADFSDILIESVNLDSDDTIVADRWQRVATSVQCLHLIDCTTTDYHLLAILSQLPSLVELHLNNNYYLIKQSQQTATIGKWSSIDRSDCLRRLRRLDMSGNKSFKLCDALFVAIVQHCRDGSLRSVNVANCKLVFHFHIIRRYYGSDCCDHWSQATHYAFTFAVIKEFCLKFGQQIESMDFSGTDICYQHLLELLDLQSLATNLRQFIIKDCRQLLTNGDNLTEIVRLKPMIKFIY